MNKEILNSLKIGEKAADIQEYYHGDNGKNLVYKVIIYECIKKFLIFKHIKEVTFPFYFATKQLAEEYIQNYNKFEIIEYIINGYNVYILFPKEFENPKYRYIMVDAQRSINIAETQNKVLKKGQVWGGIVNIGNVSYSKTYRMYNIPYNKISDVEQQASKEGTTGKTYSYKLTEA